MPEGRLANPHAILLLVGGAVAAAAVLALAGAPTSAVVLVGVGAIVVPMIMGGLASAATGGRDRVEPAPTLPPAGDQRRYGPDEELDAPAGAPAGSSDAIDDFLAFFEGEESDQPGLVRTVGASGQAAPPDLPPPADDVARWEPPGPPPPEPESAPPPVADPMFEPAMAETLPHPRPAPPPAPPTDPAHVAAESDVYRRALAQCRLAFRRHPVPTIAFDHDGTVTMMNDAARSLLAATTTPGSDVDWRQVVPLADESGTAVGADRHPVAQALAGRAPASGTWTLAARNLEVAIEAVPLVSRHDEPLGALLTLEPAPGQAPLTALDRLIWDRPEATLVMDKDGKIAAWNPAAERVLAYPRNDVVGRGIDLLSPVSSPGGGRGRLEDLDPTTGATHGRVVIHGGDDHDHEFVVVATAPESSELLALGADLSAYEGQVVCVLYPLDAAAG